MKYNAHLHSHPDNPDKVKFLGIISANSIQELKENARKHARSWNEHGGRLHLHDMELDREWYINSL